MRDLQRARNYLAQNGQPKNGRLTAPQARRLFKKIRQHQKRHGGEVLGRD